MGRGEETALALDLFARGVGLLVEGEAGVGKSHLLRALGTRARDDGWCVVPLAAGAAARRVPFGAFAHLLPSPLGTDPLRLLQQAHRVLVLRAAGARLLIVVDDAQLLDEGSAAVLQGAAATGVATVLASARLGEPVGTSLTALWKDGLVSRMELRPLPPPQLRLVVEQVLEGPGAESLHRELCRAGRGNPLFTRELVREGVASGAISHDADGLWHLTGPLRAGRLADLVGPGLLHLDGEARGVLEHVAVGEPLELELLDQVDVDGRCGQLQESRLITCSSDGRRAWVTTAHPLYGELLRQGLSRRRHREVATRLADLVRDTGARRHGDALRIARWQRICGRSPDRTLALRAAGEALSSFDFPLAERLARAGLHPGAGDHVEAMHLLGRSLLHQNRPDEAERVLSAAMSAARPDGLLREVVLARAQNLFYSGRDRKAAVEVLHEGLARLPAAAGVDISAEAALYAGARDDFDSAIELCRVVLVEPRVADVTLLRAVVLYTLVTSLDGRFGETRRWIDEGALLAERLQHLLPLAPFQIAMNRATSLWGGGQVDAGAEELERAMDRATDDGGPVGSLATRLGLLLLERGDLVQARRTLDEASVRLHEFDPLGTSTMATCARAWALAQLAHDQEARLALLGLPVEPGALEVRVAALASCARSWLAAATGDLASAGELARAGGSRAMGATHRFLGAVTLYQAVRLGTAGAVADLLQVSASHIREGLVPAMAEHARALVEDDADAAAAAAERFCRMQSRLAAAEAYAQAAALHDRRGAAVAARRDATLSQLLQRRCPGAATPALKDRPAAITDREGVVAVLAARGLRSRDIAARLYLSARTVDNHLGSTYRQLGLDGREELSSLLDPVLAPCTSGARS